MHVLYTSSSSTRTLLLTRWQLSLTLAVVPTRCGRLIVREHRTDTHWTTCGNTPHSSSNQNCQFSICARLFKDRRGNDDKTFCSTPASFDHPLVLHRAKKKLIQHQNTLLCLFYAGLCQEDQLAGFTGSCSRLIPYSQSGTQASKLFSGHKVRSSGCVITSKQMYCSYRLEDKWIGYLFVELSWEILACLHSSMSQGTGRFWEPVFSSVIWRDNFLLFAVLWH